MTNKNLLIELLVEELPPKALKKLGEAFSETFFAHMRALGLTNADSQVTGFASPRRLAVHVTNVPEQAATKGISQKLMPTKIGLDEHGQPTAALIKRLKKEGLDPENYEPGLVRKMEGDTEYLYREYPEFGVLLRSGASQALAEAAGKLPIPKVMTYQLQDGWTSVEFVRPIHGLLALYGNTVIDMHKYFGLTAGNQTRGHRFEASLDPIVIRDADSYAEQLLDEGGVIASFAERRADIAAQLNVAAQRQGLCVIEDDALLDEVTALVERPNVLLGQFEERFLDVPQECLILTMKANQKYFPLLHSNGKLSNKFLIVSNISPEDSSAVIQGNERVVRPRLADAKFFFDQDRKKPLSSRLAGLDKMVYHNKLGSQGERNNRVRAIAQMIAAQLQIDVQQADEAAQLSKADLLTDMVGEFPELQGIMGGYYARNDGLPDAVAVAIEDHYKPRFAGDALPRNDIGIAVALADKLETLVGLFGIGQIPTGDKDPFALRRHALGIVRILIERDLPLRLDEVIDKVRLIFQESAAMQNRNVTPDVLDFMQDRLEGYLREQGFMPDEIAAVVRRLPQGATELNSVVPILQAKRAVPEIADLAALNKRVRNILKKAKDEVRISGEVRPALLSEPAEKRLFENICAVAPRIHALIEERDYCRMFRELAALRPVVDGFFDAVMVNADDPNVRANRLEVLYQLDALMYRVIDISQLVPSSLTSSSADQ